MAVPGVIDVNAKAVFVGLIATFLAIPVAAPVLAEEEDAKKLEGYSVGGNKRANIDAGAIQIELDKPTFDSGFTIDKPKPMSGIRMDRPRMQVMQAPARPAASQGQGQASAQNDSSGTAATANDTAEAVTTGGANRSIRPVRMNPPEYPRDALRRGEQGHVVVEFTISTDGSTRDIEVVEAEPRNTFDREAERAVRGWRFEPALRDGRPVETRLQHTIDFTLTDEQGSLVPVQEESFVSVHDVKPVRMPQPEYPRDALRRQIEGEVVIAFSVNEAGRPTDVEILDAVPRGTFERGVLRTVETWRFEPVNGPSSPRVRHIIDFSLSRP
jgi:TonB family protein